jgi:hypothetical protein
MNIFIEGLSNGNGINTLYSCAAGFLMFRMKTLSHCKGRAGENPI